MGKNVFSFIMPPEEAPSSSLKITSVWMEGGEGWHTHPCGIAARGCPRLHSGPRVCTGRAPARCPSLARSLGNLLACDAEACSWWIHGPFLASGKSPQGESASSPRGLCFPLAPAVESPHLTTAGPLAVSWASMLQGNRKRLGWLTALHACVHCEKLAIGPNGHAECRGWGRRGLGSGPQRAAKAESSCPECPSQHGGNSLWYAE